MIHTTKAPMLVALPLTTVWPVISTLLAQHALLRSLCSLVSLSRRVMAPAGSSESVDALLEMLRWCVLPELRQYGGVVDELGDSAAASSLRLLSPVTPFAARLLFGAALPARVVVVLPLVLPPVPALSSTADAIQACAVATFMWVPTFGCLGGVWQSRRLLARSDYRVQMVDLC